MIELKYDKKYHEGSQQIKSRYYYNINITKVNIAIMTITMLTKRDIDFASI